MAEISWPAPTYNSGAVSNAEYEQLNMYKGAGMIGLHTETAPIFADSSGRQIKIRAGRYGQIHGYEWYSGTGDVVVAIAANASGSTRVDRVVLRLDRSTWTVRVAVIAGTPGAGAPAFTQTFADTGVFEISLALVTVANSATNLAAGDCVFHGVYYALPTMIAPTALALPQTVNTNARAYTSQVFFDAATNTYRYHNGTAVRQIGDSATLGASYDATFNPPMCRLILNTNFGVANNSNAVSVPFGSGSEYIKTHPSMHSTTTNNTRIIVPVSGIYEVRASSTFAPNTNGFRTHTIGKNGVRQGPESGLYNASTLGVGGNTVLPPVAVELQMNANDYVELFTFQNSGGTLNLIGDGTTTNTVCTSLTAVYRRPLP